MSRGENLSNRSAICCFVIDPSNPTGMAYSRDELAALGHEQQVRSRTGLVLDPYFSGTKLEWLLEWITIVLMIALTVVVVVAVMFRLFDNSLSWYDEVAAIQLSWVTYYGAALAALKRRHGYTGSYSSVRRFVRSLAPTTPQVTSVLEFAAGEAAQVDFGKGPEIIDVHTGEVLSTWVFVGAFHSTPR